MLHHTEKEIHYLPEGKSVYECDKRGRYVVECGRRVSGSFVTINLRMTTCSDCLRKKEGTNE